MIVLVAMGDIDPPFHLLRPLSADSSRPRNEHFRDSTRCFSPLSKGDSREVWKLDRPGRSIRHVVETVGQLQEQMVGFRSLRESIDTTTSRRKLIFHVFAAPAEFERDFIRERTRAGLDAARGKKGGRSRKLDAKKKTQTLTMPCQMWGAVPRSDGSRPGSPGSSGLSQGPSRRSEGPQNLAH